METYGYVAGFLLYIVVAEFLSRRYRDSLPDTIDVEYGLITAGTHRGRAAIDRLADADRFWNGWNTIGFLFALLTMVGSMALIVQSAIRMFRVRPEPTAANQPENVLVIPGVNDFLPMVIAPELLAGLALGMIVHEGGHGIASRVSDIGIDSLGVVFFAILPIGAFVEPSEEDLDTAPVLGRLRMYSAGVMNNMVLVVITFALLFGPVMGIIVPASGAAVGDTYPGSPAADADITSGDRITAVNGTPVETNTELQQTLAETDSKTVSLDRADKPSTTVTREAYVIGAIKDNPVSIQTTITAVNGTPVTTEQGLHRAFLKHDIVEVTTEDGGTATFPAGVAAAVTGDADPTLTEAASNGTIYITAVNNYAITTPEQANRVLSESDGPDTIHVQTRSGTTVNATVENASSLNDFGLTSTASLSGLTVSDVGVKEYPTSHYNMLLSDHEEMFSGFFSTIPGLLGLALVLPVGKLVGLPYNFIGIDGLAANFFTVSGPLSTIEPTVELFATVLFWTGWVNLNLAIFNCLPIYPFDGGRIVYGLLETVGDRTSLDTGAVAKYGTAIISLASAGIVLFMMFGPHFL